MTVPLSPPSPPPMPAPRSPPVTVSALASSPGVLVMESVRPAATARPAWVAPEASVFVPVRKSETLAFVPSSKAHWLLLVARSVRFESVTVLVTFAETTTRTIPHSLVPESVNGPAPESVSVYAAYDQPVPLDEMSSSRATPLTVTPVGVALAVVASRPAQASASIDSLTQRRGDAEIGFWFQVPSTERCCSWLIFLLN